MTSARIVATSSRGALLCAAAAGAVWVATSSCHRPSPPEVIVADAGAVATEVVAGAEANAQVETEVAAPPPIVAADPEIPLNEAVVGTKPVPATFAALAAPPAAVIEDPPPSPGRGHVWVPGYWWWSQPFHRYVWVGGAWRDPPPGQVWTSGTWMRVSPERYGWRPGFWAPRGSAVVEVIDVTPPMTRVELHRGAPGVGFVWTPGYYAHRSDGFVWTPGAWLRPPSEGLTWVEPRYVGVGDGYVFHPGRWDHPTDRRGTVYRPDLDARAGIRFRPVPVSPAVVVAHANFNASKVFGIAVGTTRTTGGIVVHRGGGGASDEPGPRTGPGVHDDKGHDGRGASDVHEHPGAHDVTAPRAPGSSEKKKPDSKH